tara:strand:- start:6 stop:1121 length:1116 start_codon:yes stop_codon:yes gene_type:complete
MSILQNLGLSGLGNSLSNFRTNIDDQTGGLLTRLGQPDNQANLIAAASLLSGEGIPRSFALRNQVRQNLLANQQLKRQRDFIKDNFPNDPLAQAFPEQFAKASLANRFAKTTPKTPTIKEFRGKLIYTANPPAGFKIGDEVPNTGGDSPQLNFSKDELSLANTIRDDVSKATKNFDLAKDGFTRIKNFFDNPSQISDYSLAVAYVKILDPTSVAREGEVAAAANSAAMVDAFGVAVQKLFSDGAALPQNVRQAMLNNAQNLYNIQANKANKYLGNVKERLDKINPDLFQFVYFGEPPQTIGQNNAQNNQPFSFTSQILQKTFTSKDEALVALSKELDRVDALPEGNEKNEALIKINAEYEIYKQARDRSGG